MAQTTHRHPRALGVLGALAVLSAGAWAASPVDIFAQSPHTEGAVLIDPGVPDEAQSAAACAQCHRDVVVQWQKSRHARAVDNALFQSALAHEPKARCVRCHAPLTTEAQALTRRTPKSGVATEGVNCAVCHIRDGQILTTNPSPTALSQKSHALRYAPALSQSAFCGSCHEFHFLDARGDATTFPIQSTYSEWLAYAGAAGADAKTCTQCHMSTARNEGGGHAMRGSHFLPAVESAVVGRIEHDAAGTALVLTAREVGHRVPTGDLYRHLIVEVEAAGVRRVLTRLRRDHDWTGSGPSRQKRRVRDTTLEPGVDRRIALPPDADRVRVHYAYTTDENARRPELRTVRTRVLLLDLNIRPPDRR